jgi:hypothetical protein
MICILTVLVNTNIPVLYFTNEGKELTNKVPEGRNKK